MDFILDEAKYYVGPCRVGTSSWHFPIFYFLQFGSQAVSPRSDCWSYSCWYNELLERLLHLVVRRGCRLLVARLEMNAWEGRQLNGKRLTPKIQGLTGHLWESSMTFNACYSFPVLMRLFPSDFVSYVSCRCEEKPSKAGWRPDAVHFAPHKRGLPAQHLWA